MCTMNECSLSRIIRYLKLIKEINAGKQVRESEPCQLNISLLDYSFEERSCHEEPELILWDLMQLDQSV